VDGTKNSHPLFRYTLEWEWHSIGEQHFFPRLKRFRIELLRQLIETDKELSSDEAIRTRLWERFDVAISRRSVANLRKALKFPAA